METVHDQLPNLDRHLSLDQLESQLQWTLIARIRNLHLCWRGDRIVIQGQAHSYHAKQLAQEALIAAADDNPVCNEIGVS